MKKLLFMCIALSILGGCDKKPVLESKEIDGKVLMYDTANNRVYTGEQKKYFDGGKLQLEAKFKDGILNGLVKSYYENGKMKSEMEFKDGIPVGAVKTYYPTGTIQVEGNFVTGLEDGVWKIYKETGELAYTEQFAKGKKIATFKNENGKLVPIVPKKK